MTTTLLDSMPFQNWRMDQIVIFGFYDGPEKGVARLSLPAYEFTFKKIAERYNPDGLDDRLFLIGELPTGSASKIQACMQQQRIDPEEKGKSDAEIQKILALEIVTNSVIHSREFENILGYWPGIYKAEQTRDWFVELGIPST